MRVKVINSLRFFAGLFLLLGTIACTSEELGIFGGDNDDVLTLNYRVEGGEEEQTYALASESHECRVDEVYALFFRASVSASGANKYVGYTRTQVSSSSLSGTVQIAMPDGEKSGEEWQIIFLANFDRNAFLDGKENVKDLLNYKVSSLTFDEARKYLKAYFDKITGLASPLPMSFSMTKPASFKVAGITFKRRAVRIDIHNSANNFVLETAQVWNARTKGYMLDEGGNSIVGNSGNDFRNYTLRTANASGGVLQSQLYAFPNFVAAPGIRDHETTCLIIGGKYGGSEKTTYYRVNVCVSGKQQNLKANHAYILDITNITGPGENDSETAYDGSELQMDYIINEWEDSFLETYVFDADGNGLAVFPRNVLFSDKGGQEVQLEVYTIKSSTNPLSGDWNVEKVTGTDAICFSAEKKIGNDKNCIMVKALSDNTTAVDRRAGVVVTWGTIRIPVNIIQMNPSSFEGIKVKPDNLWFPISGGTKEVCVSLQGNFLGLKRDDIATRILYNGTETDWLTLLPGSTADNPSAGLYYFNVTATPTNSDRPGADIKFIVTKGSTVATTQVAVTQSVAEPNESGLVRQLLINLYEKQSDNTYTDRGVLTNQFTKILGLPEGHDGSHSLQFATIRHDYLKYVMTICSSMPWKIVPQGDAVSGLNFSMTSDPGDPDNPKTIEITAARDVSEKWSGIFYVEYADGKKVAFTAYQEGVFAALPTTNVFYFYGMMTMNGRLWLDRNIGATVGQDGLKGYYNNNTSFYPSINDSRAKGVYLYRAQANVACPPGFRLPKFVVGSNDGELEWVATHMQYSGRSGSKGTIIYGSSCIQVLYVTMSEVPEVRWLVPVCGSGNFPNGTGAHYWALNIGFYDCNGTTGDINSMSNGGLTSPDDISGRNSYTVRCIRDNSD